jgi:hypothetical protein
MTLRYTMKDVTEILISEEGETILVTADKHIRTGVKWEAITKLDLSFKALTTLPPLPQGLMSLRCGYNQLTTLPSLPRGLLELGCYCNQLTTLPPLPQGLLGLWCGDNQLTTLPPLPKGLLKLSCVRNQLVTLPPLPQGLLKLGCGYNPFQKGVNLDTVPLDLRGCVPLTAYDTYDRMEREAKEATRSFFKTVLSELEATPL